MIRRLFAMTCRIRGRKGEKLLKVRYHTRERCISVVAANKLGCLTSCDGQLLTLSVS